MNKTLLTFILGTTLICTLQELNAQTIDTPKEKTNLSDHILPINDIINRPEVPRTMMFFPSDSKNDRHSGIISAVPAMLVPLPKGFDVIYYKNAANQIGAFLCSDKLNEEELKKIDKKIVETMSNKKQRKTFYKEHQKGNIPTLIKDKKTSEYVWNYEADPSLMIETKYLLNATSLLGKFQKNSPQQKPKIKRNLYQRTI